MRETTSRNANITMKSTCPAATRLAPQISVVAMPRRSTTNELFTSKPFASSAPVVVRSAASIFAFSLLK